MRFHSEQEFQYLSLYCIYGYSSAFHSEHEFNISHYTVYRYSSAFHSEHEFISLIILYYMGIVVRSILNMSSISLIILYIWV